MGKIEKQWQVSILAGDHSWHGTVEASSHADAQEAARRAAREEGFPLGGRREIFVTFLPEGRKVCPACRAQHDRPGRFCSPCINDGDAAAFEDAQ